MNYVMHFCRNSRLSERSKNYCNNGWIDKDLTQAQLLAPSWKYCRSCAEKLGIDFENQKPSDYMSEKEKENRVKNLSKGRNKNINSAVEKTGQE